MEINKKTDHQSELTFSEIDTPVPEKSKKPAQKQAKNEVTNEQKQLHSFEAKPKARPITSWGAANKKGGLAS